MIDSVRISLMIPSGTLDSPSGSFGLSCTILVLAPSNSCGTRYLLRSLCLRDVFVKVTCYRLISLCFV